MTRDDPWPVDVRRLSWSKGEDLFVEPFDFHVRAGEILIVAGNSGCGKTSLLRLLCGLDASYEGTIQIMGQDIAALREIERIDFISRRCALMFQHGALLGSYTLLENTAFPAFGACCNEGLLRDLARARLRAVGLDDVCDEQYPGKSSGGQRKRASLARALLLERPVLMCDEPSAGLHPSACGGLDRLLHRLVNTRGSARAAKRSMVVVTHDPDMIEAIGDRLLVLKREGDRTRCIYFETAKKDNWSQEVRAILDREYDDVG